MDQPTQAHIRSYTRYIRDSSTMLMTLKPPTALVTLPNLQKANPFSAVDSAMMIRELGLRHS